MASIKKLLNIISYFKCEVDNKEIVFPGILQEKNGNIILNAKFPIEQYRKIGKDAEIVVLGNVSGKKTTLIGCHMESASWSMGDNYISISAIPSEIIVYGYFSSTPMVKRITVFTSDLNYMFSGGYPLQPNVSFSKENPCVLNLTLPKPISNTDKYGKIMLYQAPRLQCNSSSYTHNIFSVVEYSFTVPLSLMDAVAKVYAARSLFSFFGIGYISFDEITFKVDDEEEFEIGEELDDEVLSLPLSQADNDKAVRPAKTTKNFLFIKFLPFLSFVIAIIT